MKNYYLNIPSPPLLFIDYGIFFVQPDIHIFTVFSTTKFRSKPLYRIFINLSWTYLALQPCFEFRILSFCRKISNKVILYLHTVRLS